jgi:hypothetical protein
MWQKQYTLQLATSLVRQPTGYILEKQALKLGLKTIRILTG